MLSIQGNKPVWLANGQPLPVPGVLNILNSQLVSEQRNANGAVVAQKIGRRQIKYDSVHWNFLTYAEWHSIRRLIENFEVSLTYWDDYEDRVMTRKFYFGDGSATPYDWDSKNYAVAKPLSYINCAVNIIDMGM